MAKVIVGLIVLCTLSGCHFGLGQQIPGTAYAARPTIALQTEIQKQLQALPPPPKRIDVSVYSFTDQTGQQQPGELPQYSRAVTQGGLAFLKQALLDAGDHRWFRVLERGGLNHLLKEREIIRSVRASYTRPDGTALPAIDPLLYSGLLLEGGIIAYESNITTGGAGARYLGIGGSTEYRRDIVTVALRAVSVKSGEVLAAVTTAKTIFSIKLQAGVFKYVSFDELLEGEAGFTVNEPPQLAVRQAIEMAVYALIMEGYGRNLWKFADGAAGKRFYSEFRTRQKLENESVQEPTVLPQEAGKNTTPPESSPRNTQPQKVKQRLPAAVEAPFSVPAGYYYQLAAVPAAANEADRLVQDLQKSGLPLTLQRTEAQGITYCRILVGPYRYRTAAEQREQQIKQIAEKLISASNGKPFLRKLGY